MKGYFMGALKVYWRRFRMPLEWRMIMYLSLLTA